MSCLVGFFSRLPCVAMFHTKSYVTLTVLRTVKITGEEQQRTENTGVQYREATVRPFHASEFDGRRAERRCAYAASHPECGPVFLFVTVYGIDL